MSSNDRAEASRAVLSVIEHGRSLNDVLDDAPPLQRELTYGVVRWYWRLNEVAGRLLSRPIRKKDADVKMLILLGLYQLDYLRIPHHAAISETVDACVSLDKPWAKGLVNAILRNFLRNRDKVVNRLSMEATHCHPEWLLERMRRDWPKCWQQIAAANNERPPMVLRVNGLRPGRDDYIATLAAAGIGARPDDLAPGGVILDAPVPVAELPGFSAGDVMVQDTAAQWAAPAVPATVGGRLLDACAAPGGKLTHLLETHPNAREIVALEADAGRALLIEQNLHRIGQSGRATLKVTDAADLDGWWDGDPFDRALIDAPCSGTGVIRRHPDIKHHRRPDDLTKLVEQQAVILARLWQTLRPHGYMLYVTCSILDEENEAQISRFVSSRGDVKPVELELAAGVTGRFGVQTLPGVHGVDGFYFALMQKTGG